MKNNLLILIILCVLSFGNILFNEFVWDDEKFIVNRPEIRTFPAQAFTEDVFELYRPIRTVAYHVMYFLFGLNPIFYHLLSIILHTLVTIIIYLILKKLFNIKLAFYTSAIFAVHPIHIGRVTNATASFDLIGIIFLLASFYYYISKKPKFSIVFFILGLFSSEEVYILPLLILLYEFIFTKNYRSTFYYFLILGLFIIFRKFVLNITFRVADYPGGSAFVTFLSMPKVILEYAFISLIPTGLSPFRKVNLVLEFGLGFILPLILILVILYLVYKHRNKRLLFFTGWFIIAMLPFFNIFPLQKIMAERYFYLASVSVFALISYLIIYIQNKTKFNYLMYMIFGILIALTIYNNTFWSSELNLMSRGIQINPESSAAYNNLGVLYFDDPGRAKIHFQNAINYDPTNVEALVNLGVLYSSQGEYADSLQVLETAILLNNANWKAYEKIGVTYLRMGNFDSAERYFLISKELNPNYYQVYSKLAALYAEVGSLDLAEEELLLAIDINPFFSEAYYNLGLVLEMQGKAQAATFFQKAYDLEPDNSIYQAKIK